MRIQHNIMAMNAYRNYNNNTSALSKNLEKLSSGYKINRAGDDAAGLAISEKMRGQIKGLEAASKNVKDGISLVKTAEGAMQEIQDMLNRMKYLATQSANGTYDKEVDRANLQKEVDSLRNEIDRIAESANFNGIKLLNGDWQGKTTLASVQTGDSNNSLTQAIKVGALTGTSTKGGEVDTPTKASVVIDLSGVTSANDGAATIEIGGATLTGETPDGTSTAELAAAFDGKKVTISGTAYTASVSGSTVTLTADKAGAATAPTSAAVKVNGTALTGDVDVTGTDGVAKGTKTAAKVDLDFSKVTEENAIGSTLTIGGKTYEFIEKDGEATDENNVAIEVNEGDDAKAILASLYTEVDKDTELKKTFTVTDPTGGTKLTITEKAGDDGKYSGTAEAPVVKGSGFKDSSSSTSTAAGLMLQIGDTSDDYNQLNVEIGEMSTEAMGIDGIDISDATSAASAINTIKDAINYVSSVRGDLGAYQNRLEHTQNNLSVMTENIQDAESTIRDTDVAEEMMKYTKNNILIQSAQAMLAQANSVPQGVLQLLS